MFSIVAGNSMSGKSSGCPDARFPKYNVSKAILYSLFTALIYRAMDCEYIVVNSSFDATEVSEEDRLALSAAVEELLFAVWFEHATKPNRYTQIERICIVGIFIIFFRFAGTARLMICHNAKRRASILFILKALRERAEKSYL